MSEIQQFIQSVILLIILTVLAVINSEVPDICILIAGIFMIVLCERSLSDEECTTLTAFQWMLSAAFAVIAGTYLSYLIFYGCKFWKIRKVEIVFPALLYGLIEFISQKHLTAQMLYHVIILLALSAIIYIFESFVIRYMSARNQILRAVSATAVNELYAKKLNQELMIKNYLVDKNARLEEREKISRNIHNSVGHSITAAIMTLDAADMLFDTAPDKAREKMNAANARIRTSLASIRQAVRVLDKENEFISMADFVGEILAVADSFTMDTMITIHTDFQRADSKIQLPHTYTEFLTGAVQELLTNGVRHGKADSFTVMLDADSGHIKLSVLDNGKSDFSMENQMDRIQNGFGLKKLISRMKKEYPDVKVLVLTTFYDDMSITQAIAGGADGYLLKDSGKEAILGAIEQIMGGRDVIDRKVMERLSALMLGKTNDLSLYEGMTSREKEICTLLAKGLSNSQIAESLFISEGTVKNYISSIYDKTGIHDRAKLIVAING